MRGLPPTPPSGGCLAKRIAWPAGRITTSTFVLAVVVWVPITLFWRMIRALRPARASSPERVMKGPGLLLQPVAVTDAVTADGIAMLASLATAPAGVPVVASASTATAEPIRERTVDLCMGCLL